MTTRPPAPRPATGRPFGACTIIARNFLAYARALASSFREHHPGLSMTVLVLDDLDQEIDSASEPFEVIRPDELPFKPGEFERMAVMYDVTELATATKPWVIRALLDHHDAVLYLDPDIKVYSPLDTLAEKAREHGIVLTPHTSDPIPRDDKRVNEEHILAAGTFNLGFIGVGRKSREGPSTDAFLDWWCERLSRSCVVDPGAGRFVDQKWIDFAPDFFGAHIERNPGFNVAYWNLHARRLEERDGSLTVNGVPLRFFHFSGYRPEKPHVLTKHQGKAPRILLSTDPVLRLLCDRYRDDLTDRGYEDVIDVRYAFDELPDGSPLDPIMRHVYRTELLDAEERGRDEPPNPLLDGPDAFMAWLSSSPEDGPSPLIGRYLTEVYKRRRDLQAVYRDLTGPDAQGFIDWAWVHGRKENGIPARLIRLADKDARFPRGRPEDPDGLNVVGYFRAELGVGEAARQLVAGIEASNIPHRSIVYGETLSRQEHEFRETQGGSIYNTNVICVNSDRFPWLVRDLGHGLVEGRHTAGLWFWEADLFPETVRGGLRYVDEVWVASEYTAAALRAHTDTPVHKVPLPVVVPEVPAGIGRRELGLPEGFLFLFVFDYMSVIERKNPLGLLEAFRRAFRPGEGPVLVFKTINGDLQAVNRELLHYSAAGQPDVIVIDRYLSSAHKNALMATADCYVSLHRSEGFGLTMAESMGMGKPVIATRHSGNLEFMNDENSFLIDCTMRKIGPGNEPYPEEASWAEPDLDQAAAFMRKVVEDPVAARTKGDRARRTILKERTPEVCAAWLHARLEDIWSTRKEIAAVPRTSGPSPQQPVNAEEPSRKAPATDPATEVESLLLHGPQVGGRSKLGWFGRALRRTVLRILRHRDHHQRRVDETLLATIKASEARWSEALRESIARGDETQATIRRWLDETERRIADVERRLVTEMEDLAHRTTMDARAEVRFLEGRLRPLLEGLLRDVSEAERSGP